MSSNDCGNARCQSQPQMASRVALCICVALGLTVTQFAVPFFAYRCGHREVAAYWTKRNWRSVLAFESLSVPRSLVYEPETQFSAAIADNRELLILLRRPNPRDAESGVRLNEVVRVDLDTGKMSSSLASSDVRFVVSIDGVLHWFPQHPRVKVPFVWKGRVYGLDEQTTWYMGTKWELLACEGNEWRETGNFLEPPSGSLFHQLFVLNEERRLALVEHAGGAFYFRFGLPGMADGSSPDDAATPQKKRRRLFSKAVPSDWTRVPQADEGPCTDHGLMNSPFIGFWFQSGLLNSFEVEQGKKRNRLVFLGGIRWYRQRPEGGFDSKFVRVPIPWSDEAHLWLGGKEPRGPGGIYIVPTADENPLIVSLNGVDGRLYILRFRNGELSVLARRASPKVAWLLVDGCSFVLLAIVMPALAWAVIARLMQRRRLVFPEFGNGNSMHCASILRRGFARAIDLSIPISLVTASILSDPDVIGWWIDSAFAFHDWVHEMMNIFRFGNLASAASSSAEFFSTAVTLPFRWRILLLAIIFVAVQLVLEARYGQTLGKWLCRIRLAPASPRRLRFSDVIVRELLLFADAAFLLSWVPGIVAMLVTARSQRLGDIWADTIVISAPARRK